MTEIHLRTVLAPAGPAAAVVLSDDQLAALGSARTPPVLLTIGEVTVRVRVARMGSANLIGLSKSNRAALGVEVGDEVDAVVALDTAPRTVTVPDDLADALEAAGMRAAFDALSYTRRREYVEGLTGAKRPQTRARRLERVLADLR